MPICVGSKVKIETNRVLNRGSCLVMNVINLHVLVMRKIIRLFAVSMWSVQRLVCSRRNTGSQLDTRPDKQTFSVRPINKGAEDAARAKLPPHTALSARLTFPTAATKLAILMHSHTQKFT